MGLDMSGLALFTLFHVLLSIAGIVAGFVVLFGLWQGKSMGRWTTAFLFFTAATTFTGFLFPFKTITPALMVGTISTLLLVLAVVARYTFHMKGYWRSTYIVSALTAFYLNCFVFVVQAFMKVPALHLLAPNGNELPFALAQGAVLLFFLATGVWAIRRLRPAL
ncbi:hypothetical protein FHS83_002374 [Rhizomicrobium palustre]|uniref:DUF2306 domain-containing protein n=1 Tax=Rhizomicrobium palustre TaxID=189966 RepID=A0A846N043_9PROT|nr:hypothetical protein [Rhizomicrobium palustre]NIK89056.1 hypothetical protein [Rhizomicrobium palustre]